MGTMLGVGALRGERHFDMQGAYQFAVKKKFGVLHRDSQWIDRYMNAYPHLRRLQGQLGSAGIADCVCESQWWKSP
jgi:hypothetical protein